ncbi:MAG: replication initiation protein [Saprospiraceae bacterium]
MKNSKNRAGNRGIALIKKSNQLIEARYKFDVWETRFFLSVLSQIRREDTDLEVYRIWYRDVVRSFGLKSNQSYDLLREAAKRLMQKSFFVNYEKDGVEREVQYHILRKIDYMKEGEEEKGIENQEYVDVTVEQEMKPLLLQLQRNFTAYDLRNVRKLGAYPVRVYELLKQYENLGERTIYIEEMKRMFELTTEYPRFPNFFQKVIKPAVREINLHTDLTVSDIEYVKEGKRVVALRFVMRRKDAEQLGRMWENAQPASKSAKIPTVPAAAPAPRQEEKDRLFLGFQQQVVAGFGVSPSVFLQELDRVGEEQIKKAIRVTERAQKDGRLKNPSGFFIEALRQDYTDKKEEQAQKRAADIRRKAELHELNQQLEILRDEAAMFVNSKIRELTTEHPELTEEAIGQLRQNPLAQTFIAQKEESLNRPLDVEDFRQDRTLREWVKNQIIEIRKPAFQPQLDDFRAKIELVEKSVGRLVN